MKESLDFWLRSWGAWVNQEMLDAGMPRKHPKGSPWAKNIRNPGDTIPGVIDRDDDEMARLHRAIVMLTQNQARAGLAIISHYRDGKRVPGLKLKRAKSALKGFL